MAQGPHVVVLTRRTVYWSTSFHVGTGPDNMALSDHDEEEIVRAVRWYPLLEVAGVALTHTGHHPEGTIDLYAEKSDLERALAALSDYQPAFIDPGEWILTWQNGDRWVVTDSFVRENFDIPPLTYRLSEVSLGAE